MASDGVGPASLVVAAAANCLSPFTSCCHAVLLLLLCTPGQALDTAKALGPSDACTMVCSGNSTQLCGGSSAFNMFLLPDVLKPMVPVVDALPSGLLNLTGSALLSLTGSVSALVGSSCEGAAASSAACKGVSTGNVRSGAAIPAAGVKLMAVVVGIFLMLSVW